MRRTGFEGSCGRPGIGWISLSWGVEFTWRKDIRRAFDGSPGVVVRAGDGRGAPGLPSPDRMPYVPVQKPYVPVQRSAIANSQSGPAPPFAGLLM